jgi:hypothetical protein
MSCNYLDILSYFDSSFFLSDTPVRLRGGWTDFHGIVEIYINKSWNSVCYDEFTQEDAKAVCKLSHLLSDTDR